MNSPILNIGDIIDICDVDQPNSPSWGIGYVENLNFDENEKEFKFKTFFPKINKKYWLYQSKLECYISTNSIRFNKNEQNI